MFHGLALNFYYGDPLAGGQQLGLSLLGPREAGGWARQGQRGVPGHLSRDSHHGAPTLRPTEVGAGQGVTEKVRLGRHLLLWRAVYDDDDDGNSVCVSPEFWKHLILIAARADVPVPSVWGFQTLLLAPDLEGHWARDGCPAPLQGSVLLMGPPTPVLWACLALDPSSVLCQRRMSGLQFTDNLCRPCVIHCLNNTRGTDCPFMVTSRDRLKDEAQGA